MNVPSIEIDPSGSDIEATGLLQRCRLLTVSAGTTNQTWSIDDYLLPEANVIFTGRVRGNGSSTRTEEAEIYGIVCAAKIPNDSGRLAEVVENNEESMTRKTSLTPQLDARGWSMGNHTYTSQFGSLRKKIPLKKIRSQSYAPESYQQSRHSMSLEMVVVDGGTKNLKECRLLSTLHHPNIVQFLGVCWVTKPSSTVETIPVILEELMLLTLKEVFTSFQEKVTVDIPLAMKISLLCDASRGLAYLHNHTPSIIHPNLKPEDVMVSSAMVAKITDLSNAQYGSKRHDDITAFGYLGAFTLNIDADVMIQKRRAQSLDDDEGDLIDILVPCFSEDKQTRPSIPKVLEKLEQLAVRVPFQFSQMGAMLQMMKEWRQEMSCGKESANDGSNATSSSTDTASKKESSPQAPSWEELIKEKDQFLVQLKGNNAELLGKKEELEKKISDLEERLKEMEMANLDGDITLSDMLTELHNIVGWFLLGIHLGVPLSDLQKIRHQFGDSVDECKTEMLITYSKLKEPSWTDIVEALRRSGERALALRIAKKYGIPLPDETEVIESPDTEHVMIPSNGSAVAYLGGYGSTDLREEVQQLVGTIKAKDNQLQDAVKHLQEERSNKNELEQEITLLKANLATIDVEGVSFAQDRQKLRQQLFLKERERHYLSLVGSGSQLKMKNTHGNELDLILVEKDREIIRMKSELQEIEKRFTREKNRAEELKSELVVINSELAIKDAHIEELEKSRQELSKYLSDERQRVDMLLMKVQVPPPIISSTESAPVPSVQSPNSPNSPSSPISPNTPNSPNSPSPKCCVIL